MHRRIRLVARDGVVRALRMVVALGVHGTHDGELVHALGHLRQQFRNLNAGDIGADRFERGVGFRIPGIDVAGASFEPEQDAGLRFAVRLLSGCGAQILLQMDSEKAQRSHFQKVARDACGSLIQLSHLLLMILREFARAKYCPDEVLSVPPRDRAGGDQFWIPVASAFSGNRAKAAR